MGKPAGRQQCGPHLKVAGRHQQAGMACVQVPGGQLAHQWGLGKGDGILNLSVDSKDSNQLQRWGLIGKRRGREGGIHCGQEGGSKAVCQEMDMM